MDDLKPLLAFAAVIKYGSMNAAGDKLGISPSAVSQHISRLERLYGVKLLYRNTRSMQPTEAGNQLAQYAIQLQQSALYAQNALESLKSEVSGTLRIAMISGLLDAEWFQAALRELVQTYPNVVPQLFIGDSVIDLKQERIDVAFRAGEGALNQGDLVAKRLATAQWTICAAPDYLANAEPITQPLDLLQHRWISSFRINQSLQRGDQIFMLQPTDYLYCNQLSGLRNCSLAGLGLSIQTDLEISGLLRKGLLQTVLPEWKLPTINLYAVLPYRVQSAKVRVWLDIVQQQLGGHGIF
ncbi:DNA-binding transcriptional regulator, LysR family [Pasteurella testudinis DSM 23072]|uniref:DNA-binding transcriptional regulator, LysR family n=1 Tax=Pasteurella testudinis DSM 23072 TaxID=1122938 RepID=A0A1W1UEG7_9PAST|nr:LysR family transcriptional regulator [Pasteurella testudinis]SMB79505.1 DNA-binding transcriptional regulator, LysR family [Pasteurella testudinis DSM 23072]SUB50745.1 glycine cleavage system transcriptional activator [Pasteurella testudinis]